MSGSVSTSTAAPRPGTEVRATEFRVADQTVSDLSNPWRWVWSHMRRSSWYIAWALLGMGLASAGAALNPILIGVAFDAITRDDPSREILTGVAVALSVVIILRNIGDAGGEFAADVLANRLERQAREELAISLLGKSQTFHNRQRVGDLMARATNDVRLLSSMVSPGFSLTAMSILTSTVLTISIGLLDWRLLIVPLSFLVIGGWTLRIYVRQLSPVTQEQRIQFGVMNAGLNEAVSGIEVVKSSAQEQQEAKKFQVNAERVRDLQVEAGRIQARYFPLLVLAICTTLGGMYAVYLFTNDQISLGELTAFLGLMFAFRPVAGLSIWTFNLLQLGLSGVRRIIELIATETEMDEHVAGHVASIRGEVVFENVSFGYGDRLVLNDVSFRLEPGQTVAIVGQTGSGKSSLTRLVNRTYDATSGRVLIDGVDVREWNLDSLRSQIGSIEQDVFLFSRSVKENIAFGAPEGISDEAIILAAKEAQADGFIRAFKDGYDTEVGERGVTLSGGQRQRIAIARALLSDPHVLMLDDATSAIDSATEDEIQLALRQVQRGRTTLMITHRLSQVRWADHILVLDHGRLVDQGTHAELLHRCSLYQRIFNRYEPLEVSDVATDSEDSDRSRDPVAPVPVAP